MREFSKRIIRPIVLPVAALGAIAIMVFSGSRILLAVPAVWSTSIAFALAAAVMIYASVLGSVRDVQPAQRGLALVLGLAVVGAGGWGLGKGNREIEGHATGVPLVAVGLAWEQTTLSVPALAPFEIELTNNDAGIPHNIGIYTDDTFSTALFTSPEFNGIATQVVEVDEPLEPGTYAFRCDFHPTTMVGTMNAAEGAGEAHGEENSPSGGTGTGPHGGSASTPDAEPSPSAAPSAPAHGQPYPGGGDEDSH